MDRPSAARCRHWFDTVRFHVGLRTAGVFWLFVDSARAVGNWFEDLATARHPRSLRERAICFGCGKRRLVSVWVNLGDWQCCALCAECQKNREALNVY